MEINRFLLYTHTNSHSTLKNENNKMHNSLIFDKIYTFETSIFYTFTQIDFDSVTSEYIFRIANRLWWKFSIFSYQNGLKTEKSILNKSFIILLFIFRIFYKWRMKNDAQLNFIGFAWIAVCLIVNTTNKTSSYILK